MHRFGRNHDGFAAGQNGGATSWFRIAGAQVARLEHELAVQQIFGVLGGQPAASLVMPMGTTSYLSLSMALRTEAAESSETSCSPLRPPNRDADSKLFHDLPVWTGASARQSQG